MTLLMIGLLSLVVAGLCAVVYVLWLYEKANNKWANEYSEATEREINRLNDIVTKTRIEFKELKEHYETYRSRHRDEPEA
jgi:hypothetical protein